MIKKYKSKIFIDPNFNEKVILNKNLKFPKITIVTPSFNQSKFLERTIISVLNQNYPNMEYIIIDGGSTDGSVDIIKKYEKYLTFWCSEKDKGQSDAINKGFEHGTGEIYAYLNSDDLFLPGTLQYIAEAFKSNKNYDLIYGSIYIIDKNDQITSKSIADRKSTRLNSSHIPLSRMPSSA